MAFIESIGPHGSGSEEPYRSIAKAVGPPWPELLRDNNLGHGYVGVTTHLAETVQLHQDSIVLLLAAEYQLSATAVLLGVIRRPPVSVDGQTRIAA